VSVFVWLLPLDLFGMGAPTSSYATTGIALRVSGTLKPHHHNKVETPSAGISLHNKGKQPIDIAIQFVKYNAFMWVT
jgi:hypothetical protein